MDTLVSLFEQVPVWVGILLGIVVALIPVAALTKTEKDDEALGKAKTFLEKVLAFLKPKAPDDKQG